MAQLEAQFDELVTGTEDDAAKAVLLQYRVQLIAEAVTTADVLRTLDRKELQVEPFKLRVGDAVTLKKAFPSPNAGPAAVPGRDGGGQVVDMVARQAIDWLKAQMVRPECTWNVTTPHQQGVRVLEGSIQLPASELLRPALQHHPIPAGLVASINTWHSATTEAKLQEVAQPLFQAVLRDLQMPYHATDTHARGFTLPNARPDISLTQHGQALWQDLISVIELKKDLTDATSYQTAVGQVYDCYQNACKVQDKRTKMLVLVMGKAQLEVWLFCGNKKQRSGRHAFRWDAGCDGYQILCAFLGSSYQDFGYEPRHVPADCSLGHLRLHSWRILSLPSSSRSVYTAKLQPGGDDVVIKTGTETDVHHEVALLVRHQDLGVLPRVLPGSEQGLLLPFANGHCTHCYVSQPLGEHISEATQPNIVLDAMVQAAGGLGELLHEGTLHRDISPDNLVIKEGQLYMLDLHVAARICGGGDEVDEDVVAVTGKPTFQSLRLHTLRRHTLTTDLESLFYCLLYYASSGRALLWARARNTHEAFCVKFACMYVQSEWLQALQLCQPAYRNALDNLRQLLFLPSWSDSESREVTAGEFIQAVEQGR